MILLHKGGHVDMLKGNFDHPIFRLPVRVPCEVRFIEEDDIVTMCEPEFFYKEFRYVTTIDDETVYKEV